MENQVTTNCQGCIYYYVTWDRQFPKGCKYFGFKTHQMPCLVVQESSGEFCPMYTIKNQIKK